MWEYNELKAAEAACKMLQLAGGQMNYMKLIKLLYIADRRALARWERPVTTDEFWAMKNGPILSHIYDHIKQQGSEQGAWQARISPGAGIYSLRIQADPIAFRELCKAEEELLETVFAEFGHMSQYQLRVYMHDHFNEYTPPDPITSSKKIELESVLEAVAYSRENIEQITKEIAEEAAINALFEQASL